MEFKRLPDAEFSVMKVIWRLDAPITSAKITENLEDGINWKPQTLLTVLSRLVEKGFLTSEKNGREKVYTELISEDEYISVETNDFLKRYSGNSLGGLFKTLFSKNDISKSDLKELRDILAKGD